MDSPHKLHELIYVSSVAEDFDTKVVASIASHARSANKVLRITGVLVFDGERFCQFLEGGTKDVVKLFERISNDRRHSNVEMLHQGAVSQRHFHRFSMGYAYLTDVDLISTVSARHGEDARSTFVGLSSHIDFGV